MKGKRISDLLTSPKGNLPIKDYAKIEYVFNLYLDEKYDTMAREIYWYKASEFFTDLATYLQSHFSEFWEKFFYRDVDEFYHEREDDIWNEIQLRKARKKYRL